MGLPQRKVQRNFAPGVPVTQWIRVRGVRYNLKKASLDGKGGVIASYALP